MKGFTLIELMIVVIIVGILAVIGVTAVANLNGANTGNNNITWGVGGMIEERCIGGYRHTISDGKARQIMDEFGKGVKC